MEFKITGLDEVQHALEALQRRVLSLSGPVAFEDLFPPEFMRRHTDFGSIEEMIAASGHSLQCQKDFEAISDGEWNAFVLARTRFKTWDAMKTTAGEEYAVRRLNLDNV